MNIIARHFRTLLFLALIAGLAAGGVMARRGIEVDLGTFAGVHITLSAPPTSPTSVVPPGLFATATPQTGESRP